MRSLLLILGLTLIVPRSALGQAGEARASERSGFIFGAALGGGMIDITGPGTEGSRAGSVSMPNLRFGYMISDRAAVLIVLPANMYHHDGVDPRDRDRDRGFDGIVPSLQVWLADRWWVTGGAGLALDAPAFYDVRSSSEGKFHFGPAVGAGTGYEIWRRGKYSLDIQGRIHVARAVAKLLLLPTVRPPDSER